MLERLEMQCLILEKIEVGTYTRIFLMIDLSRVFPRYLGARFTEISEMQPLKVKYVHVLPHVLNAVRDAPTTRLCIPIGSSPSTREVTITFQKTKAYFSGGH